MDLSVIHFIAQLQEVLLHLPDEDICCGASLVPTLSAQYIDVGCDGLRYSLQ